LLANDGVDISTTEENIRIKSEENVLILAGNSSEKPGGVLIESRAPSASYDFDQCGDGIKFGGIVLRAPKSDVVTLGSKIYMRTGGGDSSPGISQLTLVVGLRISSRNPATCITTSARTGRFSTSSGQVPTTILRKPIVQPDLHAAGWPSCL
jgi:hypothetical protein